MDERARELIAGLVADALDDAAGAELLALARRDPDVVAEIARQRALDGWLGARAAAALDADAILRALPRDARLPRLPRRRAARPAATRRWLAAAAAALVAFAAFVCWPRGDAALRVVRIVGAATIGGGAHVRAAAIGDELRAGERVALAPAASLALGARDGTAFELSQGATLGVETARGGDLALRLDLGSLDAVVARRRGADRVRIATPHAQATVVGTRFALRVDAARTVLRVEEGAVRFAPARGEARLVAAGEEASAPLAHVIELRPIAQGYADEERPGESFPDAPLAVRGGGGTRRVALVRFAVPAGGARIALAELVLHRRDGSGAVVVHAQPAPGTWTTADLRFYHVPAPGTAIGPLRDVDGAARADVTAAVRGGASEFLLAGEAGTDCAFIAVGSDAPRLRLTLGDGP